MQACLREEFLLLEPARNIHSMQKLPLCKNSRAAVFGYEQVSKRIANIRLTDTGTYSVRSFPQKKRATVPGPVWLPIVVPME